MSCSIIMSISSTSGVCGVAVTTSVVIASLTSIASSNRTSRGRDRFHQFGDPTAARRPGPGPIVVAGRRASQRSSVRVIDTHSPSVAAGSGLGAPPRGSVVVGRRRRATCTGWQSDRPIERSVTNSDRYDPSSTRLSCSARWAWMHRSPSLTVTWMSFSGSTPGTSIRTTASSPSRNSSTFNSGPVRSFHNSAGPNDGCDVRATWRVLCPCLLLIVITFLHTHHAAFAIGNPGSFVLIRRARHWRCDDV